MNPSVSMVIRAVLTGKLAPSWNVVDALPEASRRAPYVVWVPKFLVWTDINQNGPCDVAALQGTECRLRNG
jgi:hypothetical protein